MFPIRELVGRAKRDENTELSRLLGPVVLVGQLRAPDAREDGWGQLTAPGDLELTLNPLGKLLDANAVCLFGTDRVRIGRASDNDVVISEPSVSSHHASIELEPDGAAWIQDEGSSNGTFVDSERVAPGARAAIADGFDRATRRCGAQGARRRTPAPHSRCISDRVLRHRARGRVARAAFFVA